MRCYTCVHWKFEAHSEWDPTRRLLNVHLCTKAVTQDDAVGRNAAGGVHRVLPEFANTRMFVQDAENYKAWPHTRGDFFCAHHEEKT